MMREFPENFGRCGFVTQNPEHGPGYIFASGDNSELTEITGKLG
jgi:hypothetical protein